MSDELRRLKKRRDKLTDHVHRGDRFRAYGPDSVLFTLKVHERMTLGELRTKMDALMGGIRRSKITEELELEREALLAADFQPAPDIFGVPDDYPDVFGIQKATLADGETWLKGRRPNGDTVLWNGEGELRLWQNKQSPLDGEG